MRLVSTLFCIFVIVLSAPTKAQTLDSTHGAWRVFTLNKQGSKLCYMVATPSKKEGNYAKRGEPYLMITHVSSNVDEVSASSGYPYNDGKDNKLSIGQTSFNMFTKKEIAWVIDREADKNAVKQMIRGNNAVVRGTSWKGTFSKDTYSLSGFTNAHRAMKQACK